MTRFNPQTTPLTIEQIEARLSEIEQEKAGLVALKQQLLLVQNIDVKTPTKTEQLSALSVAQKLELFQQRFYGRTDIYATRWQNRQGRSGYSVACDNEWVKGVCQKPTIKCQDCQHRLFSPLNSDVLFQHLSGNKVVGLYPLLTDNTTKLLVIDLDKTGWQDEVKALSKACEQLNVPHLIERSRSGNGAHLWIFFNQPIEAKLARDFGFMLLDKAMEIEPNLSFDSYDRLFPNQDVLPDGGFGNLIALPLQGESRRNGNSVFVDSALNMFEDQWQPLANIPPLAKAVIDQLLTAHGVTRPGIDLSHSLLPNLAPWEMTAKPKPLVIETPTEPIDITLANHVYFKLSTLPNPLTARLKRLATFSNPVFFKTQALRFPTHGIARFISCARIEQGYLSLPRGCFDEAISLLQTHELIYHIEDKRQSGLKLDKLVMDFVLTREQSQALKTLIKHDTGVLHAPTAFGKTITALAVIAKRRVNTLILVHSRQLLYQWRERLTTFLPATPIGIIGGGKNKPSGVIDVATYQSLINKKDNSITTIVQDYGHVIVDECHHVSAVRYEMVMNEVRAKYVLGLTATPERQDGQQRIIFMTTGPIRHQVKASHAEKFSQQVCVHQRYDSVPTDLLDTEPRPKISDVYQWISKNQDRTAQIVDDVIDSVNQQQHPLVLTERREHAQTIFQKLQDAGIHTVILKGAMNAAQRKVADQALDTAQAVVATGRYVGEGFDLPRLDTLFLAMPIAWKGSLAQYAGRIHRQSEGKVLVTIHDYVDATIPMLNRMFNKREKSYKAMGYDVHYSAGKTGDAE